MLFFFTIYFVFRDGLTYSWITLVNLTEAKGHARSKCQIRNFPERKYLLPEVFVSDVQRTVL